MNSRLSWQQFKVLLFVATLFGSLLAFPGVASKGLLFVQNLFALPLAANGKDSTSTSTANIKDTNYPIPSGAYFVSPNGKDTNSGKNPASPWPIAKALKSAPSGATIVFRSGTYRKTKASIKKKLTLQPYPHEKVWLKGSVVVTGWVNEGGIWRKDRWTYSFPDNANSKHIDPKYPLAAYRDMVYINGVSLKQVASIPEVAPGTFYVDSAKKRLYIGDNPDGKTVEATAETEAFGIQKVKSSDPAGTVLRGLGFAHYADQAVSIDATRVTLEHNTFVWNGVQGVRLRIQSGGKSSGKSGKKGIASDVIVRGNTFSYNGQNGLRGGGAHRMLLEGNTITHNNIEHYAKTWGAAGIKFIRSDELIWRNNIVENNFATGMWIDVSSSKATVLNNTVRYNEGIGIHFELSHEATIACNVVDHNNVGIMIADSSSAQVYNNKLSNNKSKL
jgi:parallel beta-helix repeat protein